MTIKKLFIGLYCGIKGKGKRGGQTFWKCGANGLEDYGATNNESNNHEEHQHSTLSIRYSS